MCGSGVPPLWLRVGALTSCELPGPSKLANPEAAAAAVLAEADRSVAAEGNPPVTPADEPAGGKGPMMLPKGDCSDDTNELPGEFGICESVASWFSLSARMDWALLTTVCAPLAAVPDDVTPGRDCAAAVSELTALPLSALTTVVSMVPLVGLTSDVVVVNPPVASRVGRSDASTPVEADTVSFGARGMTTCELVDCALLWAAATTEAALLAAAACDLAASE
jgi:hypothetical protein